MQIFNNTILITGGASGIGFALAKRFLAINNNVIICGRRKALLEKIKSDLPKINIYQCDLESEKEREELFAYIINNFPETNVLINNAGIQQHPPRLIDTQDWKKHKQEISINFEAPLHLSFLFTKHLLAKDNSAIINITSGLAYIPLAYTPTYSATKAALHSFTQSLRYQLKDTNIEVYDVAPPAVDTDLGGVGKHTFGVSVDDFADFTMRNLESGILEFAYQHAEQARTADFKEKAEIFESLNLKLSNNFSKNS